MNVTAFEKILKRNVILPLAMTFTLCAVFVVLLFNLLGANEDLTHSAQTISKENDILRLVVDSETGLRGFLLTSLTAKDEFLEPRRRSSVELPKRLAELDALVHESPGQLAALQKMVADFNEWDVAAKKTIDDRHAGRITAENAITNIQLRKDLMDKVRSDFDALRLETEKIRDDRAEMARKNARVSVSIVVLISMVLGLALAYLGRSQLLSLSRGYEEILDAQSKQNDLLRRQAWIREGQARLASTIRGDQPIEKLSNAILTFLAEYIGANVGALFLVNEQGTLTRTGGYALAGGTPNRFDAGEGLVGRAIRVATPTFVDEVPANYLKLTSGLGDAPPRTLAFIPLTADGKPQGLAELAFVISPNEETREFLGVISELAGMALRSALYRARLQDLLHESQQLGEELQAQQEELRVSNEELSERSIALQESTARLESQQTELEQTNEQLEEQAQALESQRNDLDHQNASLTVARTELEEKADQLEKASKYKSEFLANMSHELRTPLNSSLILAKLLQDNPAGNLTEEQVHFASTIYGAGNDLLALINDILDLSKVEAGKLDLTIEEIPVSKITQGLERTFRPLADVKHLKFEIQIDPKITGIKTDRRRLEQVLRNLLSNAIKFTSVGFVSLEVAPESANGIRFTVRDTGIGIDASQHRQIFDAFHQADGTISRKYGGTGLGLSISKSLVELLGGNLEVASEKGKGSAFILRMPREWIDAAPDHRPAERRATPEPEVTSDSRRRQSDRPAAPKKIAEVPPATEYFGFPDDRETLNENDRRRLLVVEDEPDFAKILFDLGHELKFKVLLASTTADGYALTLRYLPSAVILDMKLPDGSGLTLLDRLKENPVTRHIPVHGMSVTDYSREALHLGAIGFLIKPADRDELKATLEKLELKNAQRLKRVLIVEDDKVQRESIQKLIGDASVEIVALESGAAALAALEKTTFDCMIMDLHLTDMSGFQLLENMAAEHDRAFPPVIIYTGHDLSRSEEDRLRRYSRSIIIKGARSPERLLDEVALFLHQVESKLSPERQKLIQSARSREKAFDGRRILIVDDDVRNIFALTSALENKGAKVIVGRNGREAVEQVEATRSEGADSIDLVLMDIMMPEMDGYEAIRRIREHRAFRDLPIIAITAKAMRDDYEKCLHVGANDYLAKPIELDRLISLMRVWLPKQLGRIERR